LSTTKWDAIHPGSEIGSEKSVITTRVILITPDPLLNTSNLVLIISELLLVISELFYTYRSMSSQ
jgi:hypothetical protein